MTKKQNIDPNFNQLQQIMSIGSVLADASSLIYLDKLGVLSKLAQIIKLITLSEVIIEIGEKIADSCTIQVLPSLNSNPAYATLSTDRKLVCQALAGRYCVLSDDRRILRAGIEAGLQAHAAIMMVLLLFFRSAIDYAEYRRCRDGLADFARYDPQLLAYADELCFQFGKYY